MIKNKKVIKVMDTLSISYVLFTGFFYTCNPVKEITTNRICDEDAISNYIAGCVRENLTDTTSETGKWHWKKACMKEAVLRFCKNDSIVIRKNDTISYEEYKKKK